MIPFAVLLAVLLAFVWPAQAGPFEEAARDLEAEVEGLKARVEALEQGAEDEPPESPVTAVEPGQDPLFPHRLPGRIELEDYDLGGAGVAYHDSTSGNRPGLYRSDDVDIKATADVSGGYQIGFISDGEWLEYTVGVEAGSYDVHLRGTRKTASEGAVTIRLGGAELGRLSIPDTGDWSGAGSVTVTLPGVVLPAGNHVLRLKMSGGPFDLNWIEFERLGEAAANDYPPNDPPVDLLLLSQACAVEVEAQLALR